MGRSVGTHPNAEAVMYLSFNDYPVEIIGDDGEESHGIVLDLDPFDPWATEFAWEDFKEGVTWLLQDRFPSFERVDEWVGPEGHVILRNGHAAVVLYEYCGMTSVNLVPTSCGLAEAWCRKTAPAFCKALSQDYLTPLRKLGTFSNGESVYERMVTA